MFLQRNNGWTRRIVVTVTVLAFAATRAPSVHRRPSEPCRSRRWQTLPSRAGATNIVLILTDDQRFDTLWAMPTVQSQLVAKGIEFTKGYVSNAVCCPSRSTILTGQYSHLTGVYTNHPGTAVRRLPRVPRRDRPWRRGSTPTGTGPPCWAST